MTERRVDCFFYGLFMDQTILADSKVKPYNPRRAYAQDFALQIGARATLARSIGSRTYGMIFEITHNGLDKLYSAPGLEQYRPEAIIVTTLKGARLAALCYNLSTISQTHQTNPDYASRLRALVKKLGFPEEYLQGIS